MSLRCQHCHDETRHPIAYMLTQMVTCADCGQWRVCVECDDEACVTKVLPNHQMRRAIQRREDAEGNR